MAIIMDTSLRALFCCSILDSLGPNYSGKIMRTRNCPVFFSLPEVQLVVFVKFRPHLRFSVQCKLCAYSSGQSIYFIGKAFLSLLFHIVTIISKSDKYSTLNMI